jgi:Lipocalin-like domain
MKELAATYSLIRSTRRIVDTGEVDTWGKNPNGFITYGKDGRMLVLIVSDNSAKPESLAKMTDQQQADLFRTMCAYGERTSSTARQLNIILTFLGTKFGLARR